MFTFVQSFCHHNVVSHASNLVTHLPVLLSLLNIDILSSQMSASITPQPGVGVNVGSHSTETEMFSKETCRVLGPLTHFLFLTGLRMDSCPPQRWDI